MHIHIHLHQEENKLNLIIKKLNHMGINLTEIADSLTAANDKVTKVAADVQRLHDLIAGTGEAPTAAEWQAVKDQAAALNTSLQAVDDATPE